MSKRFETRQTIFKPTSPQAFLGRRRFLASMTVGIAGASSLFTQSTRASGGGGLLDLPMQRPEVFPSRRNTHYALPAGMRAVLTPRESAASHNNFYEFLPGRAGPVWKYVDRFEVEPWKVEVTGHCHHPMTLDLDDLFKFEHEERLYHFRCVERWAMNVPWSGFPLSRLIERAQPKSSARFVRFLSANRPKQMPGIHQSGGFPWPYHESLRMEEAMNELALVVTGVYGQPLLKQHGAPVRIIVPWKYGYKNPKSIVKIEFLPRQPKNFWQVVPHEYGFVSNVNPNIPHPRWSQERSYWLDSNEWFPTPIFNGYEKYVAHLYPDEPRTPQRPLRPGQTAR
ncbi:MAG: protein-methionine-sulfoxide reductase catalytic subunit MsrP [Acidobacteriota bacterium]